VLDRALARLVESGRGDGKRFDRLASYLTREGDGAEYAALGAELGLSANGVKTAVHRLRRRLGRFLRAELAETVRSPAEVDAELAHLPAVFARRGWNRSRRFGLEAHMNAPFDLSPLRQLAPRRRPALVAYAPVLAAPPVWLGILLLAARLPSSPSLPLRAFFVVEAAALALLAVGAFAAVVSPPRGLQDRIAGTALVPR
jgi:hypothetical protein